MRNLTYGDLEISFVVIRLGVTGLKRTGLVYLLNVFGGSGKKGQCDCGMESGWNF